MASATNSWRHSFSVASGYAREERGCCLVCHCAFPARLIIACRSIAARASRS
jgi:hypothetical protein